MSGCQKKGRYTSLADANLEIKRVRRQRRVSLTPYLCLEHKVLHIGKPRNKDRFINHIDLMRLELYNLRRRITEINEIYHGQRLPPKQREEVCQIQQEIVSLKSALKPSGKFTK